MPEATGVDARLVNAAGREVPRVVNGRERIPFQGVGKFRPDGRKFGPRIATCADYPEDGDKTTKSLREALERAGLADGMVISTHHHFRNGDLIANQIFDIAADMGVKDLVWAPSASFPCHAPIVHHLESGVVHHIEGSMNGPLGDFTSRGGMRGTGILRSHGGRYQAIQDGDLRIDIAVIAAPTADKFGNATGDRGPSACGLLGFALGDSQYAEHVIVATDHLVPFPCLPWQIQGNYVDQVVVMDQIGEPEKIVSGTTRITSSPDRLLIAEYVARFVRDAGILRDGFSFQAGAGGIALAFAIYLKEMMQDAALKSSLGLKRDLKAAFVRGGSTRYLVEMLEAGLTECILDGQTFDLEGVRSLRENPRHVNTSPFTSYNYHGKGNFASMVDVVVLGATEVDVDFNANVVTHSDGKLLHGIGGWQNCLFGKCVVLAIPSFRDRIPVLVERVTTLVGPGELVDVIVTERGVAINPRREDLRAALAGSDLPLRDIREMKAEVEELCGGPPEPPDLADDFVAVINWVDGTTIDAVRRVTASPER
jgi:citrate lyase subunit alpha/citrate CoA-transferase